MPSITINGVSIDPIKQDTQLHALSLSSTDASNSDYILVQVNGPLTSAQRDELTKAGCELLEFVPENTYIARFPGKDLTQVRALPFVRWANVYLKGFKINPSVVAGAAPADSMSLIAKEGAFDKLKGQSRRVTIVVHKGVDTKTVSAEIAAAAGLDPTALPTGARTFTVTVPVSRLKALADLDVVRNVEPAPRHALFNDVAGRILRVDTLHGGTAGVPTLDGEGQIVAVCDTGFDRGSTSNTHPAFTGRVVKLIALGRNVSNDPAGHGTHVCGSVLGTQNVPQYGEISGAAPAANLIVQSVLDAQGGLGGLPEDLNNLFAVPYLQNGVRIHSNSWGNSLAESHRVYDAEAEQVDQFVHDHPDMIICFAAGNDGIDAEGNGTVDPGSVSPPGTAKNCITVGASESVRSQSPTYGSLRSQSFPAPPIADDPSADNAEGLAAFSSRGTTADGRIKPDVVAPGTSILSTLSRDAKLQTIFGPTPPAGYMYDSGTSMATPLVSGCAALVRQHLARDCGIATPSAALVKALIVNGARPLKGQYVPSEAGVPPDPDQGFGLVDMVRTVDLTLELHDEGQALQDSGDAQQIQTTAGPTGSVKVTLVWTDPPGPTLQNDLDLVVLAEGREAHGNVSAGSAAFDRVNNVEQVILDGLTPNVVVTVEIRAYRIALTGQRFALVIRKG